MAQTAEFPLPASFTSLLILIPILPVFLFTIFFSLDDNYALTTTHRQLAVI